METVETEMDQKDQHDSEDEKVIQDDPPLQGDKEIGVVETYFPGNFSRAASQSRTSLTERSDRFSMLSVQPEGPSASHTMRDVLPPLLVIFVCIIAAFLGFVVAGLHDMIKYVGCPLGVNGCNSFSGEAYEKKGYILPRALTDLPEDLIYIVAGMFCLFIIGLIVDLAPDNYGKQVLGGGTVQSLLAVAAGIPIPFKCAVLRVVITAIYFVGGGTMGGDGPTIQVCTSLSCMIGWVCGIRAARTQSLLASLGFCCGFAASFNAPLSGILFAMEELQHVSSRLTTRVLCMILIGSIVSTSVMRSFLGNKVLFLASHPDNLEEMVIGGSVDSIYGQRMWMLISLLIGVMASIVGYLFSIAFKWTHIVLTKASQLGLPRSVIFPLVAGIVASIGSAVFRSTGLRGVWVIGVRSLQTALNQESEDVHAGHLLIFALGKMAAFTLSVSARFPGDTLEPVLISGAFLGGAIGKIIPADLSEDAISSCEIFGMVGLFASCFRFPLTPVVFAIELTGTRTYHLVLPAALSCFTGLQVSNYLFPPILEQILHQDDIDLDAVAALAEATEEEEMYARSEEEVSMSHESEHSFPPVPDSPALSNDGSHRKEKGRFQTLIEKLEDTMIDVSFSSSQMRNPHGPRGRRSSMYSAGSQHSKASKASRSSYRNHEDRYSPRARRSSRRSSTRSRTSILRRFSDPVGNEEPEKTETIEVEFDGRTFRI